MASYSEAEVNATKEQLISALASFPDATAITSGLSQIGEAAGLLSVVWNTVGGASEISKLNGVLESVEGTKIGTMCSLKGLQGSVQVTIDNHRIRRG